VNTSYKCNPFTCRTNTHSQKIADDFDLIIHGKRSLSKVAQKADEQDIRDPEERVIEKLTISDTLKPVRHFLSSSGPRISGSRTWHHLVLCSMRQSHPLHGLA